MECTAGIAYGGHAEAFSAQAHFEEGTLVGVVLYDENVWIIGSDLNQVSQEGGMSAGCTCYRPKFEEIACPGGGIPLQRAQAWGRGRMTQ
jgi:hypothetical protein